MKQLDLAHCATMNAAIDDLDRIRQKSVLLRKLQPRFNAVPSSTPVPSGKVLVGTVGGLDPLFACGEWTVRRVCPLRTELLGAAPAPVLADQFNLDWIESACPVQRPTNCARGLAVALYRKHI